MNRVLVLVVFLCSLLSSQTSYNVTLFGHTDTYFGGANNADYSEVWGWTDTVKHHEYAIIGTSQGTSIVDITNSPINEAALVPGPPSSYNYHEFRTYQNYLYIGSEGSDTTKRAGIQIIDLSTLPDSAVFKKIFVWRDTSTSDGSITKYFRSHTISIEKKFLYANGGNFGGIRIMNISDPLNPIQVGSYGKGSTPYVHDSYIRNDTLYAASLSDGLHIVDMTIKGYYTNATPIKVVSKKTYPNNFTHNVWLSDNGNYAFTTDEQQGGHLRIWDITNRTTPVQIAEWSSDLNASIHNVFVNGDFLYVAYYTEGFRILDIKNPHNPIEVAFYDTYTTPNPPLFAGAWGVYPYFPSGKIAVSDMNTGLYIFTTDLKYGGNVTGVVRDATTNQPLENVEVLVQETGRKFITSVFNGSYMYGTAAGMHTIKFSKTGYTSKTVIVPTTAGIVDTSNISLSPIATDIEIIHNSSAPKEFSLSQNFPNPFNPETNIYYSVKERVHVHLKIFDLLGREIGTLVNRELPSGIYSTKMNASNLPSGIYYYRLTAGNYTSTKKMSVTK